MAWFYEYYESRGQGPLQLKSVEIGKKVRRGKGRGMTHVPYDFAEYTEATKAVAALRSSLHLNGAALRPQLVWRQDLT